MDINASKITGEQMCTLLSDWINVWSSRERMEAFATYLTNNVHRSLQQRIMQLFLICIEKWASNHGGHDARNEATVRICQKIIAATGDKYDRTLPNI